MMSVLHITLISLTLAGSAYSQVTIFSVKVFADLGANVTLPCHHSSNSQDTTRRVKWIKVADDEALNEDVLLALGSHIKTYGRFENRVFLKMEDVVDGSIIITDVTKEDIGKYHCEIMNGMEDTEQEVFLEVKSFTGVVFPYSPPLGRYNLNFDDAVQACMEQDADVASLEQLFAAWEDGLDWCNAGWLNDGTVQYPITKPRQPCGGSNNQPGLRSYGRPDKQINRYDVFCYISELKGDFYWLEQPHRLSFHDAVQACLDDDAEIAKVGHMYAAWKIFGYDRCDAGWLADGSVRYPISRPRKNCSPTEAAVRLVGFPDKGQKSYGVYCFKAGQSGAR